MIHRQKTINMYETVRDEARLYIATRSAPRVPLDEFCAGSGYSRRTVQRALQHFNLTWRMLNQERFEDARTS